MWNTGHHWLLTLMTKHLLLAKRLPKPGCWLSTPTPHHGCSGLLCCRPESQRKGKFWKSGNEITSLPTFLLISVCSYTKILQYIRVQKKTRSMHLTWYNYTASEHPATNTGSAELKQKSSSLLSRTESEASRDTTTVTRSTQQGSIGSRHLLLTSTIAPNLQLKQPGAKRSGKGWSWGAEPEDLVA